MASLDDEALGHDDSLVDLLRDALDARAEAINTCFPAKVLSYDVARQTATLRPSVQRPVRTDTGERTTERLPDLPDVPVTFLRAGDFVFHLPVQEGDFVLVLCPQWSIHEYRRTGDDHTDPGDVRHHSLGSVVAIAGVFPAGRAVSGLSAAEILLGKVAGPNVKVTATKVQLGANGPYARAARVGDPVRVTIPSGAIHVTGSMGAGSNPDPIVVDGVVGPGGGSTKVDISD